MHSTFGMTRDEWTFGALISSLHAVQHVFYRLVPPLIPILVVDLDSPLWQLGLLVSIYMFAGGLFQAPMGILSDRINRTYLAVPSIGMMAVGYLLFATAVAVGPLLPQIQLFEYVFTGTYLMMALGMLVAGIGYSGIHPVGYPLISSNITPENKGKVLGMWGSASKLGDAVAPVLVGVLVLVVSWEWILVGVAMFGFAYAGWLFGVLNRSEFDTHPPSTHDETTDASDNDRAWRSEPRTFLVPMAVLLVFFFGILFAGNGLIAFAPAFVADVYGYSVSVAGIDFRPESVANFYFAVLLISAAVSQLVSGALADRFDHRAVLITYLGVSTICLLILAVLTLTPVTLLTIFAVLGGCIFGLNPVRDALVSDISPDDYEGRTFGYLYTIALVGSSAFPTVIGYLGDTLGLQASFGYLSLGTLLGFVCISLLYSTRIYQQRVPDPSQE